MVRELSVMVDDTSPLINYTPREAWYDGDARDARWKSLVHNGTFMVTARGGSTASLTFNGTGVYLYGSKGNSSGEYMVTLDDHSVFVGNGFSNEDLFQQVLYQAGGLDADKTHRLVVENMGTTSHLVIDSIVHDVEVPDDYQEYREQDMTSSFEYSPSAWSTEIGGPEGYDGYIGQTTSQRDAYAVYDFEGDPSQHKQRLEPSLLKADLGSDAEIYGTIGPNGGPYTVQVDGGSSVTFDAKSEYLTLQTLLYRGTGLGPGPHKVRISNTPFSGQTLSIDYAVVRRSPSTRSDPTPGPPPPSLNGGTIGGIAAGAIVSILLILLGGFFWYRRKRERGSDSIGSDRDCENPKSKHVYGTGAVAHHIPSLPPLIIPPPSDSPMVSVSPIEPDSDVETDGSVAPSNSNSRTRLVVHNDNADEDRSVGHGSESMATSSESHHGEGEVKREESRGAVSSLLYPPVVMFDGGSSRRGSGQSIMRPLPKPRITSSDSNQFRAGLPPETYLWNMRMRVEGRVQDFGPAAAFFPVSDPNTASGNDDDGLLPPDYYQATQPFPHPMSVPAPVS